MAGMAFVGVWPPANTNEQDNGRGGVCQVVHAVGKDGNASEEESRGNFGPGQEEV